MCPYIVKRERNSIGGRFVHRRCDGKRLGYVLQPSDGEPVGHTYDDRKPNWKWVAGCYDVGGRFCDSRHEACMFLLDLHNTENSSQSP